MDILSLSKQLDKYEFKEALEYIGKVNDAGLTLEFLENVEFNVDKGTNLMSAIHHAYYDLLIDSDTGKYKPELEMYFPRSGKFSTY